MKLLANIASVEMGRDDWLIKFSRIMVIDWEPSCQPNYDFWSTLFDYQITPRVDSMATEADELIKRIAEAAVSKTE